MAVTHADLAPGPRCSDLGSKTGGFLMLLSILFGLGAFILCLIAETTRSEVSWILSSFNEGESERYECMYSASGKIPLLCAVGAFLGLAIAMVMEHAYMLVAVSKSSPPALIAWNPNDSSSLKALTYKAGFFFVTTWMSFAIAEVLLMIGLGVESGHLKKWWKPRPSCLIVRQGLFLAAGIFGLTTVFLASGLYLTALRAQKLRELQENVLREVLDTSMLFASPPRSPRHVLMANDLVENSHFTQELNDHRPPRREMQAFTFTKPVTVSSNEQNV